MITDGETMAMKAEWKIHSKWFIQLHSAPSLLREYKWVEMYIDFPLSFFTLETDCDQHEISIFYLMFEIWLMLALSQKS